MVLFGHRLSGPNRLPGMDVTEVTVWAECDDGDRVIDAAGRTWDVRRLGALYVLDAPARDRTAATGRPGPADQVRRLIRGPNAIAIAALRAAGFEVEVM